MFNSQNSDTSENTLLSKLSMSRHVIGNITLGGVILIAWVFFTTIYFLIAVSYPFIVSKTQTAALSQAQQQGYNLAVNQAMQTFSGNVLQNGYNKAIVDLVGSLEVQLQGGCKEPVPINIGTGAIGIVSVNCLQYLIQQGNQAPATPSQPTPEPAPQK